MSPTGLIVLWSGSVGTIPTGWVICDGNNSTPDLRDRFIVGAGSTYAVAANGGSVNHNHAFTGDGHDHAINAGAHISAGAVYENKTASEAVTGTTDNGSSLPPYYALAYIMKT